MIDPLYYTRGLWCDQKSWSIVVFISHAEYDVRARLLARVEALLSARMKWMHINSYLWHLVRVCMPLQASATDTSLDQACKQKDCIGCDHLYLDYGADALLSRVNLTWAGSETHPMQCFTVCKRGLNGERRARAQITQSEGGPLLKDRQKRP